MIELMVTTGLTDRPERVPLEELDALVRRIGAPDDWFLTVQRVPVRPLEFVQTAFERGRDARYTVERREGATETFLRTEVDTAEEVVAALTGWARRDPDWGAGLEWRPADLPEPPPVPPLPPQTVERLEELLRDLLVRGYCGPKDLTDAAARFLAEHPPAAGDADGPAPDARVTRAQARAVAYRLWEERLVEQEGWTDLTDADRLERAFAALEAGGITARENFACCRGCGLAEIGGVGGPDARGFVFFHGQSTDSLPGGGVMLYYGGFDGSEETTVAIGREVVRALSDGGLTVDWNGSPDRAIGLSGLDWRKRLVG